jgi:hypothetical protein
MTTARHAAFLHRREVLYATLRARLAGRGVAAAAAVVLTTKNVRKEWLTTDAQRALFSGQEGWLRDALLNLEDADEDNPLRLTRLPAGRNNLGRWRFTGAHAPSSARRRLLCACTAGVLCARAGARA